jgi:capsular polysaccharide transport system permease protein
MRIGYKTVLFFLVFLIPLAAFSYYELRIATDRFHSESTLSIAQNNNSSPSLDLSVIGLPTVADDKDALTLVTFIGSLDMMQYLESRLQIREHFSNPAIDWFSRLPAEASTEDFQAYLRRYIVVSYDPTSHLVTIHVEAFSRDYAQKLVNAILEHSQLFVDTLNSRVTVEQTRFFENLLKVSEARLRDAKAEMLRFQREHGLLTTDTEAQMISASIGSLNNALLSKQGELDVRSRVLNDNSPVIQELKNEIETLRKQIAQEKDKLSVGIGGAAVSELAAKFSEIQFNLEFVETIYKSNLTQLEKVRVEAAQRVKYLIVVTAPSLADASMYPSRGYNIGTAAILLMMLYFVVALMVAIIREHA